MSAFLTTCSLVLWVNSSALKYMDNTYADSTEITPEPADDEIGMADIAPGVVKEIRDETKPNPEDSR